MTVDSTLILLKSRETSLEYSNSSLWSFMLCLYSKFLTCYGLIKAWILCCNLFALLMIPYDEESDEEQLGSKRHSLCAVNDVELEFRVFNYDPTMNVWIISSLLLKVVWKCDLRYCCIKKFWKTTRDGMLIAILPHTHANTHTVLCFNLRNILI